jgi:protease-4
MNKQLSVNAESVNSNKYSDLMSGYRPLESAESEFLRSAVEKIYTDFINLVAQGRNMTPEKVDEIAQGRVWAGKDALGIGLADQQGGLYDALLSAASMAGLEGYRIVEYPVQKSAIDRLVEMLSESSVAAGNMADPLGMLENAYQSLLKERGISHMARLPYNITFN